MGGFQIATYEHQHAKPPASTWPAGGGDGVQRLARSTCLATIAAALSSNWSSGSQCLAREQAGISRVGEGGHMSGSGYAWTTQDEIEHIAHMARREVHRWGPQQNQPIERAEILWTLRRMAFWAPRRKWDPTVNVGAVHRALAVEIARLEGRTHPAVEEGHDAA
jgi:hypothetical protein